MDFEAAVREKSRRGTAWHSVAKEEETGAVRLLGASETVDTSLAAG